MNDVHYFRWRIYNSIAMAFHWGNPFLPSSSCVRITQCGGGTIYTERFNGFWDLLSCLTLEVCGYR